MLHNRYRLLRPIGRGGAGAVYEAIDLRLHSGVAVRELAASGAEADDIFRREARLLAGLRHAALPVVIDYFVEDGARFLVTQYIEGQDLAALIRRRGPVGEQQAQAWAIAILQALVYIRDRESPMVHLDIKPSTVKLTPRGDIVLVNIGLELDGRRTDPQDDLFSLGSLLHFLVTGDEVPDAAGRAASVAAGQPDPLARTLTDGRLSAGFRALLERATQLQADQRYSPAHAMLDALTAEPDRLRALAPTSPLSGVRRIDVAAPGHAEVRQELDVVMQVRFTESPPLELEDEPPRPGQTDQAFGEEPVEPPPDGQTTRALSPRLRVKLVAPDFDIRGAAECLIDIPATEYSRRLGLLLAPTRTGSCRISVEIYSAGDQSRLGGVVVETQVTPDAPADARIQVASLVLGAIPAHRETHAGIPDTARMPIVAPEGLPLTAPPQTHPPRVVVAQAVPHALGPVTHTPAVPSDVNLLAAAVVERQRRLEQVDDDEHERIRAQATRGAKRFRSAGPETGSATPPPGSSQARLWVLVLIVVLAGAVVWMLQSR